MPYIYRAKYVSCAALAVVSLALTRASGPAAQTETRPAPAPLVIDMAGDGYSLTSVADGVRFDLDGDGVPEQIAWTTAGSDDAFLALDENHNGRIDGGQELLGAWRSGPSNGFAALAASAAFDRGTAYSPSEITPADPIFKRLILWVDSNHNGVSEENEMTSLSHARVTKVFLGSTGIGAPDRSGNMFLWRAEVLKASELGVEVARDVTATRIRVPPIAVTTSRDRQWVDARGEATLETWPAPVCTDNRPLQRIRRRQGSSRPLLPLARDERVQCRAPTLSYRDPVGHRTHSPDYRLRVAP